MAEILLQPLNGKNHPVSVAFFSRTVGRSWQTNDGFLGERHNPLCEAGGLRVHNEPVPLHFLVDVVFSPSY
jgi:hypothetical protein